MSYKAEPASRKVLREYACGLRKRFGLEKELYFPVMHFLEHAMPLCFENYSCEIVPKWAFPPKKHAETDVVNGIIRIREDVYMGAANGKGRDRMTVAHEIAHYLLLVQLGIKFARTFDLVVEAYRDPEWQAKALAGEIMCPAHLIRHLTVEQIAKKCGVSLAAAKYNLKHAEA